MLLLSHHLAPATSLCLTVFLTSVISKHQTVALIQHCPLWDCPRSLSFHSSKSSMNATPGMGGANENPKDDGDDGDGSQTDADFYRDLQRAKKEKLGGFIPPEQARETAIEAESDFLRAMRETKDAFQKAKAELGSDGAVDLFIDRIREEDERNDDEDC